MTETWENDDFTSLQMIKFQIQPELILTSSNMPQKFVDALPVTEEGRSSDDPNKNPEEYRVNILKSSEYDFEASKNKLLMLSFPGLPPEIHSETRGSVEKLRYLASLIDLDNREMVRAAGALVGFLLRNKLLNQTEDPSLPIPINGIHYFALEGQLNLDSNTMQSLHIFSSDRHPSVTMLNGKPKEGFSLFGVMDQTKSQPGRRLLKDWFMRPPMQISVIEDRQSAIEYLLSPMRSGLIEEIRDCLRYVKDVASVISRIRSVRASVRDWLGLYRTTAFALRLSDMCKHSPVDCGVFSRISRISAAAAADDDDDDDDDDRSLQNVVSLIEAVIDFDESKSNGRLIVKPGVDKQLDELRQMYGGLDEFLTEIARQEMERFHHIPWMRSIRVVYYPQIGCQICVPKDQGAFTPSVNQKQVPELEFQFQTEDCTYFKSPSVRQLDRFLGDIHNDIIDRETSIIRAMENKVLLFSDSLLFAASACAELDCLVSLAVSARKFNLVRPKLVTDNVISIRGGRHPLQEMCVPTFIPNDTLLGGASSSSPSSIKGDKFIHMITGPNYSGKSVYIKQVGIIVFMAHIGSFVPAESAVIGLCDRIFTRIHSRESVSLAQSTFMIDCHQLAIMIRHCSDRSLLIVDEFGKGTNPQDGVALLSGAVEHLVSREECPKVLITTHFNESIEYLRSRQYESSLEFYTMSYASEEAVVSSTSKPGFKDDFVYLYKLVPGVNSDSFGIRCAFSAGISPDLLRRAIYIGERLSNGNPIERLDHLKHQARDNRHRAIIASFLRFDPRSSDLNSFLASIFDAEE